MRKQTLVFTALPNGVTGSGGNRRLRLSVHLSPRLVTDEGGSSPPLSLFPDFVDWPSTPIAFGVQFGAAAPIPATRVGPSPRSDLWMDLMPATAGVESYAFQNQYADALVQTYPVRAIHSWLKGRYTELARTRGTELPTVGELLDTDNTDTNFAAISLISTGLQGGVFTNLEDELAQDLFSQLREDKYLEATGNARKDFLQAKLFHKPFSDTRVPLAAPQLDAHQVLAALGQHPALMRMVGLVYDLEIPYPGALGATTVQVLATWTPKLMPGDGETVNVPNPTGLSPRLQTRCIVDANEFRAAPRASSPDQADGMLRLEDTSAYELVQIDPDGGALKALTFAENLLRTALSPAPDRPGTAALPSLRSAGIAIARVGRGKEVHEAFERATANNSALEGSGDVMLDAEDVTRGYAFDVNDSRSMKWHSLFERVGDYNFPRHGKKVPGVDDEGWMSLGVTSPQDDSSPTVKLTEKVVTWEGWSLAAPRPGMTMGADGNPASGMATVTPDSPLDVQYRAKPGSLPRQRFGFTYRMRARAVDLAGNRLSMADADAQGVAHATPPFTYGRFEPVPAPAVVLRDPLTEGEHPLRLVFRSNYFGAPVQPAPTPAQRHIVPEKTTQNMAELLELWDNPGSGQVSSGAWGTFQSREGGSFWDIGVADPNDPKQVLVPRDNLSPVPYLPEFLARGAILRGLPWAQGPVEVRFDYPAGQSWPKAQPFLLRLVEGKVPPTLDRNRSLLTVFIDKADVMRVPLSSHLDPDDTDRMGLIQWLIETLGAGHADVARVRDESVQGINWMITPFKTLVLVHAVRQPLLRPRFLPPPTPLTPDKKLADTFATLTAAPMEVSRKSTVRLEIFGKWQEPIDSTDPAVPPTVISGKARAFEFPVPLVTEPGPPAGEETRLNLIGRHEFGDTKHRNVDYWAVATTRFGEYFVERLRGVTLGGAPLLLHAPVMDDDDHIDGEVENLGGVVPGSEQVTAADRSVAFTRDQDYTMDYAAGTITALPPVMGVPVDIAFIAPPITRKSAEFTRLNILSSKRPDAPRVLYVLPTFEWDRSGGGGTVVSRRLGGGVRVYLDRPWWSSGEGELLGVVLWQTSRGAIEDRFKPYVTQWGLDPLYRSPPTDALPNLDAFSDSGPGQRGTGVTLDELPGEEVDVAGHAVAFDPDRKLWFCDIKINPRTGGESYFPFVRLALARYQPDSVPFVSLDEPDAFISRVVLADFIQLAPDRFASVTRDGTDPAKLDIVVSGLSFQTLRSIPGPGVIEVSIERLRSGVDPVAAGELAWEATADPPYPALTPSAGPAGTTEWAGSVQLPPGPGPHRIVIKEFEIFGPGDRRLVYANAIVV